MKMRFGTRTFLLSFLPFAALLATSFWIIQHLVQSRVREGLRSSLRESQLAITRARARGDSRNSRFLRVVGENSALKAGIQLMLADRSGKAARSTVEDQLLELGGRMDLDFLVVSAPDGAPLAGILRTGDGLVVLSAGQISSTKSGLVPIGGRVLQVDSVAVDQNEENIGSLSVGEYFDLSEFTMPAVLLRGREVVLSNLGRDLSVNLAGVLTNCGRRDECDFKLAGANYISIPIEGISLGTGYTLRSLQNVDSAVAPVQAALGRVFAGSAVAAGILALFCGFFSARAIMRPLGRLVAHLRAAERTGLLPEFTGAVSGIQELAELTESFNRAAGSVREARNGLQLAYVEFAASLANALEARDRYTAGHSLRVSQLAFATARALGVKSEDAERIRVGALLHDIGKIGVPDSLLQKPGRLTLEEFSQIQRHPVIGRRILEAVQGFAPYLPAVELHHENWDGSGYPHRRISEETPLDARIIHVADAYDAMTTDRPYRRGMPHEIAVRTLRECAGSQFDPAIVEIFARLNLGQDQPAAELAEVA